MIRFFAICLIGSWGSVLAAQDIVVRTGDHPTFSRLVLSVPSGIDWQIIQISNGYRLAFDPPIEIDVSRFYERIQRNRIADFTLNSEQGQLDLRLGCNCFAEAFSWRTGQIIVDIKDPGTARSPDTLSIVRQIITEEDLIDFGALPDPPATIAESGETTMSPIESRSKGFLAPLERRPLDRQSELPNIFNDINSQSSQVQEIENALLNELNRAISQGLLNAPTGMPQQSIQSEDSLADLLTEVEAALIPGLAARTSIDTATKKQEPLNSAEALGTICIPEQLADVASWGSDAPFINQIGYLRSSITGEFDRTDMEAIDALSRGYIYFGFGREAIAVLSIDGRQSQARQVMQTIGELIDNDELSVQGFENQIGCSGPIALWGLLAHQQGPASIGPNVEDIVREFKRLPKNLRRHLAPRLAKRLKDLGYNDIAVDVLSIALETVSTHVDAKIVTSDIFVSQGEEQSAVNLLTDLVEDDPRATPEGLLKLLDIKLERQENITEDELTLLRSFLFEGQEKDTAEALYLTEIRAMSQLGRVQQALDMLRNSDFEINQTDFQLINDSIMKEIVDNSSDIDFLEIAFGESIIVFDIEIQNDYAARLLQLGFPKRAASFVLSPASGGMMMERRYLRAEIAFAIGDFEKVNAHLAGLNSNRAQLLRARVGIQPSQDVLEALEPEQRQGLALQFEDWIDLERQNEGALSEMARRTQSSTIFDPLDNSPLSSGTNTIQNSAALRENVAELLDELPTIVP